MDCIGSELLNILRNGGVQMNRGFVQSDLKKMRASQKADQQLCTGTYLPSGSCHGAQQLVALASMYVCMYICTVSKPQVSEVPQAARLTLCIVH